jgi:hypothetical protein
VSWGTDCSSIWGNDLSKTTQVFRYAILPHAGTWEDAGIWETGEARNRRPVCFAGEAKIENGSPVCVRTDGVEVSAFFTENGKYYIRLFNSGNATSARVALDDAFQGAVECTLDKKENGKRLEKDGDGCVSVEIQRFGLRTLRLLTK